MPIQAIDSPAIVETKKYETPTKLAESVDVSTPETDLDSSFEIGSSDSVSSDSSASCDREVADIAKKLNKVSITEHRKLELEGKLKPEPLLVENPGRFVLFPIQNPEVGLLSE